MPIRHSGDLGEDLRQLQALGRRMPRIAGALGVAHFKQSFKKQGFTDRSLDKWPERKRRDGERNRRAILIKTGALRRSVRIVRMGHNRVIVGSELSYAQIHNEGGRISGTQQIPQHRRKTHTRRVRGRRQSVSEHSVSAHSRNVNFEIPQRQFLGNSRVLNRKIERKLIQELRRILS